MKINIFNKNDKNIWLKIFSIIMAGIVWVYIMGDLGYETFFGKKKYLAKKWIKGIPIKVMCSAQSMKKNMEVAPEEIDITVQGSEKNIEKITKRDILAYVDVSNFSKGKYFLVVKLKMPEGFMVLDDVKTVKVNISDNWDEEEYKLSKGKTSQLL